VRAQRLDTPRSRCDSQIGSVPRKNTVDYPSGPRIRIPPLLSGLEGPSWAEVPEDRKCFPENREIYRNSKNSKSANFHRFAVKFFLCWKLGAGGRQLAFPAEERSRKETGKPANVSNWYPISYLASLQKDSKKEQERNRKRTADEEFSTSGHVWLRG
jgi:hypothetical protein